MGEAKRRGTYQQRKAQAEERQRLELKAREELRATLIPRRPSPKHVALMATMAAMTEIPSSTKRNK